MAVAVVDKSTLRRGRLIVPLSRHTEEEEECAGIQESVAIPSVLPKRRRVTKLVEEKEEKETSNSDDNDKEDGCCTIQYDDDDPSIRHKLSRKLVVPIYSEQVSPTDGLAIVVTVLGLNLLGDGLRDLLDPRLARKR